MSMNDAEIYSIYLYSSVENTLKFSGPTDSEDFPIPFLPAVQAAGMGVGERIALGVWHYAERIA